MLSRIALGIYRRNFFAYSQFLSSSFAQEREVYRTVYGIIGNGILRGGKMITSGWGTATDFRRRRSIAVPE